MRAATVPPLLKQQFRQEYVAWQNMKTPCCNPKHRGWPNYGGKGIRVCPQWMNSFEQFLKDVGPKPGPEYRLSRLDLSKDFTPGNVVWEISAVWGVLKRPLPDGFSREDVKLASSVGKVIGVRPSALLIMLGHGLTTAEQLNAVLAAKAAQQKK